MGEERESPSAGWREVYEEMGVDSEGHEPSDGEPERCPDCGLEVEPDEEHHCPLAEVERVDAGGKHIEVRVEKVNGNVEVRLTPGESDD